MKNSLITQLTNIITSDEAVNNSIEFISLLGSYRVNEAILNYSDFDLLFILRDSDNKGEIELLILNKLREINNTLSSQFKVDISFLTHTTFDFYTYVGLDYLVHYSWGDVIYGNHREYRNLFLSIIKNKTESEKERRLNMCYAVIHCRFNSIRKYVSVNKHTNSNYLQYLCKLFIDNIIEIADYCLMFNNHYSKSKKEIVQEFKKIKFIKNSYVLEVCFETREKWNQINNDTEFLNKFILIAVEGMQQITKDIVTEYELFKTNNNI